MEITDYKGSSRISLSQPNPENQESVPNVLEAHQSNKKMTNVDLVAHLRNQKPAF